MNKYIAFTAIGMELVGLITAATFVGKTLDDYYGLKGLGIIGFSILALVGWILHVITLAKKLEKLPEEDDQQNK